ncbi:MAG: DUF3510 domain-containing protein [Oscillospiraceae bacterium]|nr:DUF3510 domain-containing protein [Oscillospiraceae bacterium]
MSSRQVLFNEIETLPENYVDLALQAVIIIKQGGLPFGTEEEEILPPLSAPYDRDEWLREAIAYHEAGGVFLTAEESLERLREAIKRGAKNGV